MLRLDDIFDRTGTVKRPPYSRLLREAASIVSDRCTPPDPAHFHAGEAHVVLIVPAFLTGDFITADLRRFLGACGYRTFGWAQGINWGPTPSRLRGLRDRLRELRQLAGEPISVIGVSLGGLLVRDLAHDFPDDIRHVITLASPIRLPTASTIESLFHLCAPFYSDAIDLKRLSTPLPMGSTSIFTRDDGLIAWESCVNDDPGCTSIEVKGRHLTICQNPEVLSLVAKTLGQLIDGGTAASKPRHRDP